MNVKKRYLKKTAAFMAAAMLLGSVLTVNAEESVYTVKKGDNLYRIAKEVYGSKNEWRTIYEANKETMKNAGTLSIGQQLILPNISATEQMSVSSGTSENEAAVVETPSTAETPNTVETALPQGNIAVEGTVYTLNMPVDIKHIEDPVKGLQRVFDMGTVEFSYTKSNESEKEMFESDYYGDKLLKEYAAPKGYEWRKILVDFRSRGGDFADGSFFYNECEFTGSDVKGLWRATWEIDRDFDIPFEEYRFTLHYNGTDYTECKLIPDIWWSSAEDSESNPGIYESDPTACIMVLLPKGYDGVLYYNVYGSTLADGEPVRNDGEYVSIPL